VSSGNGGDPAGIARSTRAVRRFSHGGYATGGSTLLKQADKVAPGGVDSPEDKEAILLGVRLADYWPTITKDKFCKEFDQVSSKLEKSGTQNCEPSNEIWPSMIPPIR